MLVEGKADCVTILSLFIWGGGGQGDFEMNFLMGLTLTKILPRS